MAKQPLFRYKNELSWPEEDEKGAERRCQIFFLGYFSLDDKFNIFLAENVGAVVIGSKT